MRLLTAVFVEKCHILAGIYFIFLKKRLEPNVKGFPNLEPVIKLGKLLTSKLNFNAILQNSCSNFRLKLPQRS